MPKQRQRTAPSDRPASNRTWLGLSLGLGIGLGALALTALPLQLSRTAGKEWLEIELGELRQELDTVKADFGNWQSDAVRQPSVDSALQGLRQEVDARLKQEVEAQLQNEVDARLREQHSTRIESAASRRHELRRETLEPVIQLTGLEAAGSAVLVHRGEENGQPYSLALSCFHVVRDILDERGRVQDPLSEWLDARIERGEDALEIQARMLAYDEDLDLALLRLESAEDLGPVAKLASPERVAGVEVFSPVYTVGCPLGTSPQATRGEVTHMSWDVDGQRHWMVSSPAYYGNSGGGVFLAESREMIGIYAKIYTHGSFRPQVITHMGLVIPLPTVRAWLAQTEVEPFATAE